MFASSDEKERDVNVMFLSDDPDNSRLEPK